LKPWTEVIEFWFGPLRSADFGWPRKFWFQKSARLDAEIRSRFAATLSGAAAGRATAWMDAPLSALALIVVLDQFPRNMYRDGPLAFSYDSRALEAAQLLIERGFDRALQPVLRVFAYLPFGHSEALGMQRRSLELFAPLACDLRTVDNVRYARRHYEIIARFGRFPHRNAVLGRTSTTEELAFLEQPGSGF
jgi:uncharacterized protein (DUF924 family)